MNAQHPSKAHTRHTVNFTHQSPPQPPSEIGTLFLAATTSVLSQKYGCYVSERNGAGFGGATTSQCSSLRRGATPKTVPFRPNP